MSADPIWAELERIERRRAPRLDPAQFANCPICHLPASEAFRDGRETWGVCNLCSTKWRAGNQLRPLLRRDAVRYHAEALTEYTELPTAEASVGPTNTEEGAPMLTDKHNTAGDAAETALQSLDIIRALRPSEPHARPLNDLDRAIATLEDITRSLRLQRDTVVRDREQDPIERGEQAQRFERLAQSYEGRPARYRWAVGGEMLTGIEVAHRLRAGELDYTTCYRLQGQGVESSRWAVSR